MTESRDSLSEGVKNILKAAGWSEDGNAAVEADAWQRQLAAEFPPFPKANEALRRFGGLQVRQSGTGEECARESFDLDPTLAAGESDRFREFASMVKTRLYPLGEGGNGHVFLAISEDGRVFALMEDLWLVGDTIEHALETLVRGRHTTLVDP